MKNEFLRSVNSIQTMRDTQKPFVAWAKSQEIPLKKIRKNNQRRPLQVSC